MVVRINAGSVIVIYLNWLELESCWTECSRMGKARIQVDHSVGSLAHVRLHFAQ
jgi:hypothetical protein